MCNYINWENILNKAFKLRIYPNKTQANLIDKTFGCTRFLYNQMLAERIEVYEKYKEDKEKLYSYKYKTEKEWKKEFEFLKEVPSRALQQVRIDLDQAYRNFYKRVKKGQKSGFPKFKKKGKCKDSYRDPQVGQIIRFNKDNTKINLLKIKFIKIKGFPKNFKGKIKSATILKTKSGKYFVSILVEIENQIKKERKSNNIVGVDLGLKEFAVCSNGEFIKGIKDKMYIFDKAIHQQQKHLSRKQKGSKRWLDCKKKLNILWEKRQNYLNHFQWHLANKLASENQVVSLENLNVIGMRRNRKLSCAIHNVNWSSFLTKLEQKAKEYDMSIHKVDRFFPSSKLCSNCGALKDELKLSERVYHCDCGIEIDRDLNAAINLKNNYFVKNNMSLEYSDYKHGEKIRPKPLNFEGRGIFVEVPTENK